jgi:hypothetical protein
MNRRVKKFSITRTRTRATVAGGIAVAAAAAAAVSLSLPHGASSAGPAAVSTGTVGKPLSAKLISSSCGGPAGAAYVADAGWDGFSAINTANCSVIQTYNVGDPAVPGDPDDSDYASTDEGIAIHGSTLYFADTGNSSIAVINAATLNPKDYNPAETDIHGHLPAGPGGYPGREPALGGQHGPANAARLADVGQRDQHRHEEGHRHHPDGGLAHPGRVLPGRHQGVRGYRRRPVHLQH